MIEVMVSTAYWMVLGTMLVGALLGKWLCNRLERHHPEVWKDLGEPSLFMGASMRAQGRISKFLRSRAYENLGDERLILVAAATRVLMVLILIVLFVAAAGFAYFRA